MPWLALALLAMIAVLLRQPIIDALLALAEECSFQWGAYRGTLRLTHAIGLLGADELTQRSLRQLRVHAHEALGQTARAVEGARRLADEARTVSDWSLANTAINTFINAGLYQEALEVERRWEPQAAHASEESETDEKALARFNLCEALYNLGDWEAARARLREVEEGAAGEPLLRHAILMQRAWIHAHTGQGAEALAALEQLNREDIPRVYWSEVAFTRAAALLELGRYDEAGTEARAGLKWARRVASRRNGLFMLGRIALAAGRLEEAARHFEAGAVHPYRGQGGGALLAWGDCLERLGRGERAREAWRLVLERDPQSAAAREAASRLGLAGWHVPGATPLS